jgi:hypothetical protein
MPQDTDATRTRTDSFLCQIPTTLICGLIFVLVCYYGSHVSSPFIFCIFFFCYLMIEQKASNAQKETTQNYCCSLATVIMSIDLLCFDLCWVGMKYDGTAN